VILLGGLLLDAFVLTFLVNLFARDVHDGADFWDAMWICAGCAVANLILAIVLIAAGISASMGAPAAIALILIACVVVDAIILKLGFEMTIAQTGIVLGAFTGLKIGWELAKAAMFSQ